MILFVLGVLWFLILCIKEYQVLTTDPLWLASHFSFDALLVPLLALTIIGSALFCLKSKTISVLSLGSVLWILFFFFGYAENKELSFYFIIFSVVCFLLGSAGSFLLCKGSEKCSCPLGYLFVQLILSFIFFYAAQFEILSYSLVVSVLCGFGMLGLYHSKQVFLELFDSTKRLSPLSAFLLFVLLVFLSYTYTAASLPQTYADGLVYRLPFLRGLVQTASIPNHEYLWAWLIPQPGTFQMVPAYFLLGEIGAAWTVLSFLPCLLAIIYSFVKNQSEDDESSLVATVLIGTLPAIWLLSTAIYNDIQLVTYSIAGFYLLHSINQTKNDKSLYLSAVFLAFASSIKLNAPILVLSYILIALVFSKNFRKYIFGVRTLFAIAFGLTILLPWYGWVKRETGNPFFPFLNSVFPPYFNMGSIFTAEAHSSFSLSGGIFKYLLIPWELTFSTSDYGTYPNASFGIMFLLFLPFSIYMLVRKWNTVPSMTKAAFFGPIASFLILGSGLGMFYFRYSLAAYVLLGVAMAALLGSFNRWKTLNAVFLSVFALFFLILVGSRINYGGGLGLEVHAGELSREDFIDARAHGVARFINERIAEDEKVISSLFFHVNRINNHAYFVSKADSLFGEVSNLENIKNFIKKENIRYWISDTNNIPLYLQDEVVQSQFFSKDKIVYARANFLVYDMKKPLNAADGLVLQLTDWSQQKALKEGALLVSASPETHLSTRIHLEQHASISEINFRVNIEKENAAIFIDVIFFNDTNEISRTVLTFEEPNAGTSSLKAFASIPEGAKEIQYILRPWREVDGKVEFLEGSVTFR